MSSGEFIICKSRLVCFESSSKESFVQTSGQQQLEPEVAMWSITRSRRWHVRTTLASAVPIKSPTKSVVLF